MSLLHTQNLPSLEGTSVTRADGPKEEDTVMQIISRKEQAMRYFTILAIGLTAIAFNSNADAQSVGFEAKAKIDPEAGITEATPEAQATEDTTAPPAAPASDQEVMGVCAPLFTEGKASADLAIWKYSDDNRKYYLEDAKTGITNVVLRTVPKGQQKKALVQLEAFWIMGAENSENIAPQQLIRHWKAYNAYLTRNNCTGNGSRACKNLRDEIKACAAAVLSRVVVSDDNYKARAERMFNNVPQIGQYEDDEMLQILFYHGAIFLLSEEYWDIFISGNDLHGVMKFVESDGFTVNIGRNVDVIRFGKSHIHGYKISEGSSSTKLMLVNGDGYAPPITLEGQDLAEAKVYVVPGSSPSSEYYDALASLAGGRPYRDYAARLAPTADPSRFLNYRAGAFWKDGRKPGYGKIGNVSDDAFFVGDTRVTMKDLKDEEVLVMLGDPPGPSAVSRLGNLGLSLDQTPGFCVGSDVKHCLFNMTVLSFEWRLLTSSHLALKARVGLGMLHANGYASYASEDSSFADHLNFLGKAGVGGDYVVNDWFSLSGAADLHFTTGGIGGGTEVLAVFSVSKLVSLYGGVSLGYLHSGVEAGGNREVREALRVGDINSVYVGPTLGLRLDL